MKKYINKVILTFNEKVISKEEAQEIIRARLKREALQRKQMKEA